MNSLFSVRMNAAIRTIIAFDFVTIGAIGLLTPIHALFIVETINGGTVAVVGSAIAVYWIVKSVLQLFVARYLDNTAGERDDFFFLMLGTAFAGVVMLAYALSSEIWHIYLLQALWGAADALATPPYYSIFTRHVDEGEEASQWSIRSSVTFGGGSAIGSAVGGLLAAAFGFQTVFFLMFAILIGSVILLVPLYPHLDGKRHRPRLPEERR